MIKWILKRYLNKKLEDLNFQILSLEQELGYADIEEEDMIRLQQAHKENIWDRNNLEHVVNIVNKDINNSKFMKMIKKIKCNHDYKKYNEHMIDFGMGKILYLKCNKCDKEKRKVI